MRSCGSEPAIDDPEYIRRMIRENLEAQQRVEGEIKTIDAAARAGGWLDEKFGAIGSPAGVRVDVCRPDTEQASKCAAGIAEALERAGFQAAVISERGGPVGEPHLECGVEGSAAALFLQGAFRIAGIPILMTVDHRLTNSLRLHVGEAGLIARDSAASLTGPRAV